MGISLLALAVGTLLPLLVALVTKSSWPEAFKSVLLAFFSALTGVGTALESPNHASVDQILTNALASFVAGAAVAAATWKPTGAIAKLEALLIKDAPFFSAARRAGAGRAAPFFGPVSVGTQEPPGPADHQHATGGEQNPPS